MHKIQSFKSKYTQDGSVDVDILAVKTVDLELILLVQTVMQLSVKIAKKSCVLYWNLPVN